MLDHPITINRAKTPRFHPDLLQNIPFGKLFADHMLEANFKDGSWQEMYIRPYEPISLSPATSALHYGQSIFEGLKAYRNEEGRPVLFRAEDNWQRMNRSAWRMAMPEVPREVFIGGLKELIRLDERWIPNDPGSALYIRPFLFATDDYIGIRPSSNYRFIIFCCPVGAYYSEPIPVKFELEYARACPGGAGYAKAAGNYGAALRPAVEAQQEGYRQLIWTDAKTHEYIEESGTMNIFFHIGNKVITPATGGTILEGITRDSVIHLLKDRGIEVEERRVKVAEIVEAFDQGQLKDVFGAGTAATIAPVSSIGYKNRRMDLPNAGDRELSQWLFNTLEDIRRGRQEDKWGWVMEV